MGDTSASARTLSFRTETWVANPRIGTVVTTVSEIELSVELPEGALELPE